MKIKTDHIIYLLKNKENFNYVSLAKKFNEKFNTNLTIQQISDITEKYYNLTDSITAELLIKNNRVNKEKRATAKENKILLTVLEQQATTKELIKNLCYEFFPAQKIEIAKPRISNKKVKKTINLVISDVHLGAKNERFNLEICIKRISKLVKETIELINQESIHSYIEKINIFFVGDLIEGYTLHGDESIKGCEFSNSVQTTESIKMYFNQVIIPLYQTGIEVEIYSVNGNHSRMTHNKTFHEPGIDSYEYIILETLQQMCELSKINIRFNIAKDDYQRVTVYGKQIILDHGYCIKNTNYQTMLTWLMKRQQQEKIMIDHLIVGHTHEFACHKAGQIIINGSVVGEGGGYGKNLGYISYSSQTVIVFQENKGFDYCKEIILDKKKKKK